MTDIEYAAAKTPQAVPLERLYFVARRLAVVPLALGIGCLAAFWLVRSELFVFLGLFMLLAGPLMLCISALRMWQYAVRAFDATSDYLLKLIGRILLIFLLYSLNLAAAGACLVLGGDLMLQTPLPITVRNASSNTVSNVSVIAANKQLNFGTIEPGKSVTKSVLVGNGGDVRFKVLRQQKSSEVILLDHMDSDAAVGTHLRIRIDDSGIALE